MLRSDHRSNVHPAVEMRDGVTEKPCPGSGKAWTVDKSGNPICPRCRRGLKAVAGMNRSLRDAPKVPKHDVSHGARSTAAAGQADQRRSLACPDCGKQIRLNPDRTLRAHDRPQPGGLAPCPGSHRNGVAPPGKKPSRRRDS